MTSVTSSSATVALTVHPSGLAKPYQIEYGPTISYGSTTPPAAVADVTGVQSESVPLSGLAPCTTYHYQAEALNSANQGQPGLGGDQTFTTQCSPPVVTTGSATAGGQSGSETNP